MMALALPLLAWLALHLWLLIDCLRRREFAARVGGPRTTRAFWIVALLLFNPLLSLAYLILVRLGPRASPRSRLRTSAALAAALIAVLLQFGWFWGAGRGALSAMRPDFGAEAVFAGQEAFRTHLALRASTIRHESSQTAATSSVGSGPLVLGSILVSCEQGDEVLEEVARNLVRDLADEPWLLRVAYLPSAQLPPPEPLVPDLVVRLGHEQMSTLELPLWRHTARVLTLRAGSAPWTDGHGNRLDERLARQDLSVAGRMRFALTQWGFVGGTARFESVAEVPRAWLREQVVDRLRVLHEAYGVVARLPEGCAGPARERPRWKWLAELGARPILDGSGPLLHRRTVWTIAGAQPEEAVAARIAGELAALGFAPSGFLGEGELLELRALDGRRFWLTRARAASAARARPSSAPWFGSEAWDTWDGETSWVAEYQERFDDEAFARAQDRALEDGRIEAALMLRLPGSRAGSADLLDRIAARPGAATPLLLLARGAQAHGDHELAAAHARAASSLLRLGFWDASLRTEVERLHADLGLEFDAGAPADAQALERAGLPEVGERQERAVEVLLGEPARFFARGKDGSLTGFEVRLRRRPDAGLEAACALRDGGAVSWTERLREAPAWSRSRGLGAVTFSSRVEALGGGSFRIVARRP